MDWNNILSSTAIDIIGGVIGIILIEKMNETLIAATEFISLLNKKKRLDY